MKKKLRAKIYLKNGEVIDVIFDHEEDKFSPLWLIFERDEEMVASVLRSEIVAVVYETLQEKETET